MIKARIPRPGSTRLYTSAERKICPRIFMGAEDRSERRIGRNLQIEPELGASKAGDADFTGRLGREANSNSIDDGLGSLTRASHQRPFKSRLRNNALS